jgi:hypothetical protein
MYINHTSCMHPPFSAINLISSCETDHAMAAQTHLCRFLALPAELRLQIYDYVYSGPKQCEIHAVGDALLRIEPNYFEEALQSVKALSSSCQTLAAEVPNALADMCALHVFVHDPASKVTGLKKLRQCTLWTTVRHIRTIFVKIDKDLSGATSRDKDHADAIGEFVASLPPDHIFKADRILLHTSSDCAPGVRTAVDRLQRLMRTDVELTRQDWSEEDVTLFDQAMQKLSTNDDDEEYVCYFRIVD